MSEKDDEIVKYFHFPIDFLRNIYDEKKTKDVMYDILRYTVYSLAIKYAEGSDDEKIISAAKYLNLKMGTDPSRMRQMGKTLYDNKKTTVIVNVITETVWDHINNNKSEFDIACFCAFAATRSFLGKKPFVKMTNNTLIARMFGYASFADIPATFKRSNLYKRLTTRYYLTKIKKQLAESWYLKYYADHSRGFYISYRLDFESLILHAEKNRKQYKEKVALKEKNDLVAKVRAKLANELR